MLLDTEAKVAVFGEVDSLELILLDLQSSLQDLLSLQYFIISTRLNKIEGIYNEVVNLISDWESLNHFDHAKDG